MNIITHGQLPAESQKNQPEAESFWGRHKVKILIGAAVVVGVVGVIATIALAVLFWPVSFGAVGAALTITLMVHAAVAVKIAAVASTGIFFAVATGALAGVGIVAGQVQAPQEKALPENDRWKQIRDQIDWKYWPLYVGLTFLDDLEIEKCNETNYIPALHHSEQNPNLEGYENFDHYESGHAPSEWFDHDISWKLVIQLKEIMNSGTKVKSRCMRSCKRFMLDHCMCFNNCLKVAIDAREGVLKHFETKDAFQVIIEIQGYNSLSIDCCLLELNNFLELIDPNEGPLKSLELKDALNVMRALSMIDEANRKISDSLYYIVDVFIGRSYDRDHLKKLIKETPSKLIAMARQLIIETSSDEIDDQDRLEEEKRISNDALRMIDVANQAIIKAEQVLNDHLVVRKELWEVWQKKRANENPDTQEPHLDTDFI